MNGGELNNATNAPFHRLWTGHNHTRNRGSHCLLLANHETWQTSGRIHSEAESENVVIRMTAFLVDASKFPSLFILSVEHTNDLRALKWGNRIT
jgi:hypothetical protein